MNDANAAYMAAMGATSSDDAEMYQEAAEDANEVATENHTGMTGAGMAYMRARDANVAAGEAADIHVLGLLKLANADHINGGGPISFANTERNRSP